MSHLSENELQAINAYICAASSLFTTLNCSVYAKDGDKNYWEKDVQMSHRVQIR